MLSTVNTPGLSPRGLDRLRRRLAGHVERGALPGLVALIARGDQVHVETFGTLAAGDPRPMPRDAVVRLGSIAKPVTAAAAMLLVEDGALRLDDPVDPWLPELAGRRVLTSLAAEPDDRTSTVPARRAVTVRDLLTSRMGFGSVLAPPDTYPIQRLIREHRIGGDGPPRPARLPDPDAWLQALGALPWMAHPGERWLYHVSLDVLGVLVARVAGRRLGAFLRERLFEPLGMRDAGFAVRSDQRDRLPACYVHNRDTGALDVFDRADESAWAGAIAFESGAGGLVGTADDCLAFFRMLLNGGRHEGPRGAEQILSRAAVALMTADHLTPVQRVGAELFFGADGGYRSWGFGMAVDTRRHDLWTTPGRFGWDGGFGTSAYADPAEGVVGVLLTQRLLDSPEPPRVFTDFWTAAYGALE